MPGAGDVFIVFAQHIHQHTLVAGLPLDFTSQLALKEGEEVYVALSIPERELSFQIARSGKHAQQALVLVVGLVVVLGLQPLPASSQWHQAHDLSCQVLGNRVRIGLFLINQRFEVGGLTAPELVNAGRREEQDLLFDQCIQPVLQLGLIGRGVAVKAESQILKGGSDRADFVDQEKLQNSFHQGVDLTGQLGLGLLLRLAQGGLVVAQVLPNRVARFRILWLELGSKIGRQLIGGKQVQATVALDLGLGHVPWV